MRRPSPVEVDRAGRGRLVLASLAVLLAAADTYVVVLAFPDIILGVGLGLDELQRATPIVSAFLLGYVAALPLIGRLSDLRGRVPVLVGCLLLFALGSLLTASADSLFLAVAGRALQGVGGGGLVPATLALVADLYPPARRGRPLGAVGAVQEVGSVLGPLYGAAVLAVSGWRAIFWINLAAATALAALLGRLRLRRVDPVAVGLGALALLGLVLVVQSPTRLVQDVTLGLIYVPIYAGLTWISPLSTATLVVGLALAGRLLTTARRRHDNGEVDWVGAALLGLCLAGIVVAFAGADPSREALVREWPVLLGASAVGAGLFVLRQRRARHPLVPPGTLAHPAAWGALAVNLFVGAALVAALVDVPLFARVTRFPDSQLGAALTLVQLLAALPVGALAGGWATGRTDPGRVAGAGMALAAGAFAAMSSWDARALYGFGATAALVAAGLGFGLAIAPINVALLASTRAAAHGVASALVVVARTVGMLVGLSVLTAVGLGVFYARQAEIGSPLTLCPTTPSSCPAYDEATRAAVIDELNAIFLGAGVCAAAAAVLALVLLRPPGNEPEH